MCRDSLAICKIWPNYAKGRNLMFTIRSNTLMLPTVAILYYIIAIKTCFTCLFNYRMTNALLGKWNNQSTSKYHEHSILLHQYANLNNMAIADKFLLKTTLRSIVSGCV